MLRRMRPLFSVGLGARLGSGRQYVMDQPGGRGAGAAVRYRAAQPVRPGELDRAGPVTNAEFTTAFGRAVNRPTPLMLPSVAVRAAFGEFADEGCSLVSAPSPPRWSEPDFSSTTTPLARRSATPPPGPARLDPVCPAVRWRPSSLAIVTGSIRSKLSAIDVRQLGTVDYRTAWQLQRASRRPGRRRRRHAAAVGTPRGLHRRTAYRDTRATH